MQGKPSLRSNVVATIFLVASRLILWIGGVSVLNYLLFGWPPVHFQHVAVIAIGIVLCILAAFILRNFSWLGEFVVQNISAILLLLGASIPFRAFYRQPYHLTVREWIVWPVFIAIAAALIYLIRSYQRHHN